MGDYIELRAADSHHFKAYRATPEGTWRGAVVIAPEIFGVNAHIRSVADRFAQSGYLTLAPQLFDRVERDYEAGYDQTDVEAGRAVISDIEFDEALRDLSACVHFVSTVGKVAVVGYCWGGTIAWLAAAQTDGIHAAVAYYGGGIPDHADAVARVPLMLHFAEQDTRPSLADAQAIAARYPQHQSFFYPAGHGFNCDMRGSYHAESAAQAGERTLAFLREHIG